MNFLLIGASAGSIDNIERLLFALDTAKCTTLLAVHIDPVYLAGFVDLLQKRTLKKIEILKEFSPLVPGSIYVCDSNISFIDLCQRNETLYVRYNITEKSIYNPDISYLFESVAKSGPAKDSVAMLLSGIGNDGAYGLKRLKARGSLTLVLDEKEAPIFGIPKAAIELEAHCEIVEIERAVVLIERFWNEKLSQRD